MTKWVFAGKELHYSVGLENYNQRIKNDKPTNLDQIRKEVISRYSSHFLTIEMEDENLFGKPDAFQTPPMLAEAFDQSEVASLKGNLIWVRVKFPQFLASNSLQYMNCNLNCFPVINCKYFQNNTGLKEKKTFFSVQCEGKFLSLISILDKNEKPVVDQRATSDEEKASVTYNFKEQGIQRFDNREAKELLDYLFSVLRDESFAFNKYKVNVQSEELKNLRQQVNSLVEEMKKDRNQELDDNPFLIFTTKDFPQIIRIEYCATFGEFANKIAAGNKLKVLKGILLDGTSLAFMTSTWGGRSYVDDEDKIRMFKHALISRGSLVTKMDIVAYCKAKLGYLLEDVYIEHGAEISLKENEGIIRTMNVNLVLKEDRTWNENELIYIKNDLKEDIESRSCFIYPIRIIANSLKNE